MLIILSYIVSLSRRAVPPTFCGLLTLFLLMETANGFGKKPIVVPEPPPVVVPPVITPVDPSLIIRARWETKARDGALWSQYVFGRIPVIAPNLLTRLPADAGQFCANYANLNQTDKQNFWLYLVSAMTELESNFDPNTKYTENFKDADGKFVISAGLMQLSITDSKYGCDFKTSNDLLDPYKNLDCGLRILNKWVQVDGRISGKNGTAWAGGARYWSVLRNKMAQITGWTQAQRLCAK